MKMNNKANLGKILRTVLFVLLILTNIFTLKLYLSSIEVNDLNQIDECADEIVRAKYFIKDWYDELSSNYSHNKVYKNEIRFDSGQFTLTVAANRIRAVYPRGTRFFQMKYITYIEFFEENDRILCKFYYNETGESVFKLN